jgi:hypothetical protein
MAHYIAYAPFITYQDPLSILNSHKPCHSLHDSGRRGRPENSQKPEQPMRRLRAIRFFGKMSDHVEHFDIMLLRS